MDRDRTRNFVGIAIGILVVVGFGLGRVLGGVGGDGPVATCDDPVPWDEAATIVGERGAVAGTVAAVSHEPGIGGAPTFLNLGNVHPEDPRFDVVVYEEVTERFDEPLDDLEGAEVCAQGQVRDRDGVPQIVLDAPSLLSRR